MRSVGNVCSDATRRTCASLLAALDVYPRVAMQILRHPHIAVTMDVYSTRATSYRRWRVADRLGSQVVGRLLADRRSGMTKPALAARYAISLSNVKRMLK
jgi:hypothetical protein